MTRPKLAQGGPATTKFRACARGPRLSFHFCTRDPAVSAKSTRVWSTVSTTHWHDHLHPSSFSYSQIFVHYDGRLSLSATQGWAHRRRPSPTNPGTLTWPPRLPPYFTPINRPQAVEIVPSHDGSGDWTPASNYRIFHSVALKWEARRVLVTMLGYGAHRNLLGGTTVGSVDVDTTLSGVHRATKRRSR